MIRNMLLAQLQLSSFRESFTPSSRSASDDSLGFHILNIMKLEGSVYELHPVSVKLKVVSVRWEVGNSRHITLHMCACVLPLHRMHD